MGAGGSTPATPVRLQLHDPDPDHNRLPPVVVWSEGSTPGDEAETHAQEFVAGALTTNLVFAFLRSAADTGTRVDDILPACNPWPVCFGNAWA
jgi:hypothetical protein